MKEKIEAFVTRLTEESNADLNAGYTSTNGYDPSKKFSVEYGRKYAKIVSHDSNGSSEGVWGFVEIATGNILKAAGWAKPAKHARGHIDTAVYGRNYHWTGPAYLR
jgi:hypothetical protein